MFKCKSDGEAIYSSDDGSGNENVRNSEEFFPRGDGSAPGILVPPAAMADQNATILRRAQFKVSRRAQRTVGVPGSENAPAHAAVELSEWGEVDIVV